MSLVHLVNRCDTKSSDFKDYEFSRATVDQLWRAGRDDVQKVLQRPQAAASPIWAMACASSSCSFK
ncbi:MAG: DUF3734 domain-containing protein [Comamonadaceae bacterium]|nr:DUF3734 domain-containing protein [Comamonadaceae bacterium]